MNASFKSLFWTQFFGALNDNLLKNALVALVTYQGLIVFGWSSGQVVALAGGVFILPFFLFSKWTGHLADRVDKAKLIRWTKIWEVLIAVVSAGAFITNHGEVLLIALFMMGCHSTLFGPVKYSAIPDLVPADDLLRANGWVEAGTFIAILIGTMAGGYLVQLSGGRVWIGIAMLAAAGIGLWNGYRVPSLPPVHAVQTLRVRQLNRQVWRDVVLISWFWFIGASLFTLLPLLTRDVFYGDTLVMTLFLSLFTLGVGVGSFAGARLGSRLSERNVVFLGAGGLFVFMLDLGWAALHLPKFLELRGLPEFIATAGSWRLIVDFLLLSISGGMFVLPLYASMQRHSPHGSRSQVVAFNNILNAAFMVTSAGLLMLLFHFQVGPASALLLLGLLHGIISLLSSVFNLRA